ncbi:MAG: HEAT repeat domain-containing protein [Proteobacteria bacterium]|nr:HEAT repeat domain-containing protein [Pseudomonadota bacterium]
MGILKKSFILILLVALSCSPKISKIDVYTDGAKKGDESAIKSLLKLLEHYEEDIKVKAYGGLIMVPEGKREFLSGLILNKLKSEKDVVTKEFLIALAGKLKIKSAVPVLIDMARDKSYPRRYVVYFALGEIGDISSISTLIEGLEDERVDVQKYASRAIIKLGPKALPVIFERFNSLKKEVQGYLIRAMGEIRDRSAEDLLISQINSENKYDVIWALGKVGTEKSLPYLLSELKNPDYLARVKACQALGDLNQPSAIPYLRKLLSDKEVVVREWSARSLEVLTGERTYYIDEKGKPALPYSLYH